MKNLNDSKCEHTGGWFVAQIILVDEVINCPTILTNDNASQMSWDDSQYSQLDILPVRESIKINATPRSNGSGTSYSIKAEFEIATQSKEIDTFFNDCIHKKVLLLGQKHYGQQILYGSPNRYMGDLWGYFE